MKTILTAFILLAFISCREQRSEPITSVDSAFLGYDVSFNSAKYGRSKEISKNPKNEQIFYGPDTTTLANFLTYEVTGRTTGSFRLDVGNGSMGNIIGGGATITNKGAITITPTPDFDGTIYLTIKP